MSTHVTREQLDRLRDGMLPPGDIALVGRHAGACQSCGAAVGEVLSLSQMTRDLRIQIEAGPEPEHLSDDELMACADEGPRHDHLKECETCRADVDEISELKRGLRPRRNWVPYGIAASIGAIVLLALLLSRRSDTSAPTPPPRRVASSNPVVTQQPPSVPHSTGYARKEWAQWVAEVKERRELSMPAVLAALHAPKSHLRAATDEDDLKLRPSMEVVASSRPRFHWARRDAATYNVILQIDDQFVESGPLADPQWTVPIHLQRGREYAWQIEMTIRSVRSIYPQAPDAPARFRVLEQSALDEIDDARKRHPDDFLLHAVILARHGLRDEALEALEQLARTDPALTAALRESVRNWQP